MARIVTEKTDESVDQSVIPRRGGAALSGRTRLALGAMQGLGLGGFYVIVLIYFSLAAAPYFFSESNAVNILSNISVIGIVTLGQAYVLIAGGFDLSVAGTVPLGGVIFTMLINRGLNVPEAWAIALLVRGGLSVLNGLIIPPSGFTPLGTPLSRLFITGPLACTRSH